MIKLITKLTLFSLLFVFAASITAAPKKNGNTSEFVVKKAQAVKTYLYFQGNVQPIKQYDVLTPIAGLIGKHLNFVYGALVHQGQYLLSVMPDNKQNSYRTALIAYLRAKSTYSGSLEKFTGQKLLYKNGIVARNDFTQYRNNLVTQKLALKEAFYSLEVLIRKMSNDIKAEDELIKSLSELSINNSKVYDALDKSFSEVKIHAPITGIALLPESNSGNNASKTKLHSNSLVKLDQVLLVVGDFTGLKVEVNVSEVSINKLHIGQTATITGPAFPNIHLRGKIQTISYQAKAGSFDGALPTYPVSVVVPKLTTAQKKIIHAGMTAKIKIALDEGDQLLIPIKAVHLKSGKSYVLNKVGGKAIETAIGTGNTTIDKVEVTSGLKVGDKIVVPN